MSCSGPAGTDPTYPANPGGTLYDPPQRPVLTWSECAPNFVCLSVNDAAILLPYLDAADRWMSDHQNLCNPE